MRILWQCVAAFTLGKKDNKMDSSDSKKEDR